MEPNSRVTESEEDEFYIAPLNKLRNYNITNGISFLLDLGRRFRHLDKKKENRLYHDDFIGLMKEMNLLSEKEAEEAFMDNDINDRGFVLLDEFIKRLRGPIPRMRSKAIEDAVIKADLNNDGLIPLEYLEEFWDGTVQSYLGEDKTADERKVIFLELLKKDAEYKGYVTEEELTNFHWVQSLLTEDDTDFVLTLRQAYHLDSPPSGMVLGPEDRMFTGLLNPIIDGDE